MKKSTSITIRIIRFIRLLFHIASGILQSIAYPHFSRSIQHKMMKNWAMKLLKILHIRLHHTGKFPDQNVKHALLVANHVSWLDICLLMAVCPTQFVAKSEIRSWPAIGFLCKRVGTVFISRAKRSDTMRTNQTISNTLLTGERVCIFPEGTTSNGMQPHHFHASLLQSAVNVNALLYPVAIRYLDGTGNLCRDAAYIGISLMTSLQKILSQPNINAVLDCSEAIKSEEKNRRELARLSEQAIANSLSLPAYHNESEKPSYLPYA